MNKKTMLAMFVTGVFLVTPSASVFADSIPSAPISPLNTPVPAPVQSNSDLSPDSTSPPNSNSWWDLSTGPYDGLFSDVRTGIYTDYYFTPSSSGELYLNQTVSGTAGQDFVVELLDYTDNGGAVYSNIVEDNSSTVITWPNLNTSHHYEVWWAPENSNYAISGNFEVYD